MNQKIEQMLLENGASIVGFARIDGLYNKMDLNEPRSEDSATEPIKIPNYPLGISIILAHPKDVIKNIRTSPTMDYYNAYHRLNHKLDDLAVMCAEYIREE